MHSIHSSQHPTGLKPPRPAGLRPQRPLAQLTDLLLVQLSNWRWAWPQLVLTGMITPVASMLALLAYSGRHDHALTDHIVIGPLILALLFQNQNQVAGNFAFMKQMGTLDFFAAQPVSRALLAIATVCAFFLLSLPALFVTVVAGVFIVHIHLSLSPLLFVVVPLCVVPAACIGATIGSMASTMEESNSASLVVTFLMAGLGPVLVPASRLPAIIRAIGVVNPATYAASALQAVLLGPITIRLLEDVAVLAAFGLVALLIVIKKMPWRQR
jgi:ABC-2 type transport system permease protein